ncbi:MAG TPA: DUF4011 domain-containing protein [Firmicutes bacterium]|nr:DUF4011 domain-containing protein [Bacillota bacterium]
MWDASRWQVAQCINGDPHSPRELEGAAQPEGRVAPGDLDVASPVRIPKELKDLYRKLERLRRGTRTIYEEQGVHTLFVPLGLLQWRETYHSGEQIRSPLLLVPVQLERTVQRLRFLFKHA